MKKNGCLILVFALFTSVVFAEDGLKFSGEVKTGLAVESGTDIEGTEVKIANYDSAGEPANGSPGYIRANFHYTRGFMQFKWRLEADAPYQGGDYFDRGKGSEHKLGGFASTVGDIVKYAYAMGDFFDNQIRLSAGKFDAFSDSPWSTMGDELWQGVDSYTSGIRFEYKPSFVPGLNAGFFLPVVYSMPGTNGVPDAGWPDFANYLREVGLGVTYAHDALEISVSGYLDGNGDGEYDETKPIGFDPAAQAINGEKGGILLWRVNPKIISKALPGFSFRANGYLAGLPTIDNVAQTSKNRSETWLYISFKKGPFEGKLNGCFYTFENYYVPAISRWMQNHDKEILIKPMVNYAITPNLYGTLEVPVKFAMGFGDSYRIAGEDPKAFSSAGVEAKLAISLPGSMTYGSTTINGVTITPVYHFEHNAAYGAASGSDEDKNLHRFELRFVWAF
jgi:hypothetical protein